MNAFEHKNEIIEITAITGVSVLVIAELLFWIIVGIALWRRLAKKKLVSAENE
tara:strand:- start:540 stop:698 length:159 start_codon:yes stop_codon:yes gene_type:complete